MSNVLASIFCATLVNQVPGYNPVSWVPSMGFGSSPALTQTMSDQLFQETAWVSDGDTYQPVNGTNFVVLNNSAIHVESEINSGTLFSTNVSFDPTTGKKTYTYVIRAKHVTVAQSFIDEFYGVDDGTIVILKDTDTAVSQNAVTIGAPNGSGGGG